jgi:hypothetical protein
MVVEITVHHGEMREHLAREGVVWRERVLAREMLPQTSQSGAGNSIAGLPGESQSHLGTYNGGVESKYSDGDESKAIVTPPFYPSNTCAPSSGATPRVGWEETMGRHWPWMPVQAGLGRPPRLTPTVTSRSANPSDSGSPSTGGGTTSAKRATR